MKMQSFKAAARELGIGQQVYTSTAYVKHIGETRGLSQDAVGLLCILSAYADSELRDWIASKPPS